MQEVYWGMERIKERKTIWKWRHQRGKQADREQGEGGTEYRDQKPWTRSLKLFVIWCETTLIWINFAVDTRGDRGLGLDRVWDCLWGRASSTKDPQNKDGSSLRKRIRVAQGGCGMAGPEEVQDLYRWWLGNG